MAQLRRLKKMFPEELVVIGVHSAKFPSDQLSRNICQAIMLGEIERLPLPGASSGVVETLEPVKVAPGQVRIILDVRLPAGYHRSPDIPAALQVGLDGQQPQALSFPAEDEIAWKVNLGANRSLAVDLTLYYCSTEEAALCMVHDRRLRIPLEVTSAGPAEVRLPYLIRPVL